MRNPYLQVAPGQYFSLCKVIDVVALPRFWCQLEDEQDPHLIVEGQVIKAPNDVRVPMNDKPQEPAGRAPTWRSPYAFQRTKSEDKTTKQKEKIKKESMK